MINPDMKNDFASENYVTKKTLALIRCTLSFCDSIE